MRNPQAARLSALFVSALMTVGPISVAWAKETSHDTPAVADNAQTRSKLAAEGPFFAENESAMNKMMNDMSVKPTGDVDHDFVAMMVPHHQGAIDMAQAELSYGHNEQLRRIAQEIVVEQLQEIAAMRLALGEKLPPSQLLLAAAAAVTSATRGDNSSPSASAAVPSSPAAEAPFLAENDVAMTKMMNDMTVKPTGDVDCDFVAMMVPHHQGAIDMAQAELRYGHNAQLRRISQEIIVDQMQEITLMRLAAHEPLPSSVPSPTQSSKPAAYYPPTSPSAMSPTMQMKK